MGCSKSSSKRKIYSDTGWPISGNQKTINNLTLHLQELEKEQTKPQVSRRKEIIIMKVEINEIDTKKKNKIPRNKRT